MKPENKLARVFAAIAAQAQKTDSIAAEILGIVAEAKVRTVEQLDPLVYAAYEANGWNARQGRPSAGAPEKGEVPATVRTYVTTMRRALRVGVRLAPIKTMYALRKALRKALEARRPKRRKLAVPKPVRENFLGVNLEAANDVTGALIHDIGAVYAHLPGEPRRLFEKQLKQLVDRYLPLAKGIQAPQQAAA